MAWNEWDIYVEPETTFIWLQDESREWSGSEYIPIIERGAEEYDGPYSIRPTPHEEQVLGTRGKLMADDVTVQEIPYYLTSNPSEGYTAIIGE